MNDPPQGTNFTQGSSNTPNDDPAQVFMLPQHATASALPLAASNLLIRNRPLQKKLGDSSGLPLVLVQPSGPSTAL
jgi:hypothetical protein